MILNRKRRRERQQVTEMISQVTATIDAWAEQNGTQRKPGEDNLTLVSRVSGVPVPKVAVFAAVVSEKLQNRARIEELLLAGESQARIFVRVLGEAAELVGMSAEFERWNVQTAS